MITRGAPCIAARRGAWNRSQGGIKCYLIAPRVVAFYVKMKTWKKTTKKKAIMLSLWEENKWC